MTTKTQQLRLITFGHNVITAIAEKRGLLAAEGLELDTTVTPNSTVQMRGLINGEWDMAGTAFDNVLAWSGREGPEVVMVAQSSSSQAVMLPLYVRPEIKDWSDLRGKAMAVDAVDTAYALVLRRILLAHGLDYDRGDYTLVPAGATQARLESMKRGETFAAILNPPVSLGGDEAGFIRMADHREVLPDYPGSTFAVARSWAEAHRAQLVAFLRAHNAALRWGRDPANKAEAEAVLGNVGRGLDRLPANLRPDLKGLEQVLDLRVRFGMTPPLGADVQRFVDTSYLDEAE